MNTSTLFRRVLILGCLGFSSFVYAVNINNGKVLHDQHCVRCHAETEYNNEKSRITDYKKLRARVGQCELMLELAWFADEVDDVTAYLNQRFYRFDVQQ